jgi:hypothetical protein
MWDIALFLASFLIDPSAGTLGVDISSTTYVDAFQCLVSQGYTFAVIRAYQSIGQPDPVWYKLRWDS